MKAPRAPPWRGRASPATTTKHKKILEGEITAKARDVVRLLCDLAGDSTIRKIKLHTHTAIAYEDIVSAINVLLPDFIAKHKGPRNKLAAAHILANTMNSLPIDLGVEVCDNKKHVYLTSLVKLPVRYKLLCSDGSYISDDPKSLWELHNGLAFNRLAWRFTQKGKGIMERVDGGWGFTSLTPGLLFEKTAGYMCSRYQLFVDSYDSGQWYERAPPRDVNK